MTLIRKKRNCFVIMPFGIKPVEDNEIDFDKIFDHFIRPAVEVAGFKVVRSDREVVAGLIMPRVFSSIYEADLVIGDLSYQNPNVYYELGVRHALCRQGTLLIQRAGGDYGTVTQAERSSFERGNSIVLPFDVKGVTVWQYELSEETLSTRIDQLATRIASIVAEVSTDSPAFMYLEGLRVLTGSPRPSTRDYRTYELVDAEGRGTACFVGYRSGDLKHLKDTYSLDYWVNSENVLMQMARIYERSISSTIRFLGALQPDPSVAGFDDTIANDLLRALGTRNAVNKGEVLVTTSGRLRETHGVKAILHAAAVTGAPGRGFEPLADDLLVEMVGTVIQTANSLSQSGDSSVAGDSIIMPLFGTGQGRRSKADIAGRLVDEAIEQLSIFASKRDAPDTPGLRTVLFSAFTQEHVSLLRRLFNSLVGDGVLRHIETANHGA